MPISFNLRRRRDDARHPTRPGRRRERRMQDMPTRYHVAVRRPDDDAILVLSDGSMPGFSLDAAPPWPVVAPVVAYLRSALGLEVEALRVAWLGAPDGRGRDDRLVEVSLSRGRVPIGARWLADDRLER